jgi:hypothetical protein
VLGVQSFWGFGLRLSLSGEANDQVVGKMRQLLGVLGRATADLDEHLFISLYNYI